jgi:hypothetical protein
VGSITLRALSAMRACGEGYFVDPSGKSFGLMILFFARVSMGWVLVGMGDSVEGEGLWRFLDSWFALVGR